MRKDQIPDDPKNWMAPLLERHLRPVSAPKELWSRVIEPRPRREPVFRLRLAFSMMMAMATGWALHIQGGPVHNGPVRMCGEPEVATLMARDEREAVSHRVMSRVSFPQHPASSQGACANCHIDPPVMN